MIETLTDLQSTIWDNNDSSTTEGGKKEPATEPHDEPKPDSIENDQRMKEMEDAMNQGMGFLAGLY